MKGARRIRVGRNVWHVKTGKNVRLLVQVRGGKVRAVGIANKRLSRGRVGTKRFLRAWRLP